MDKELYREVQSLPEEQFIELLKKVMGDDDFLSTLGWSFTRKMFAHTVYVSIQDEKAMLEAIHEWTGCSEVTYETAFKMLLEFAGDERVFGALIAKKGQGLIVAPVLKEADKFKVYNDYSMVRKIDISKTLADYLEYKRR